MPQLVFTGIKENDLIRVSKELTDELSDITGTGRDIFSLKLDESKYIFDGALVTPVALVDVYWFERPKEVQDDCAKAITKYLSDVGYPEVEVVFHLLYPEMYYVDGEHL